MIENFEELKVQLKDLSGVINSFKSEAVQLKIVELIFGMEQNEALASKPTVRSVKPKRKKTANKPNTNATPKKSGKKASGQGAVATLGKLIEEGFFTSPKSIGDITQHCDHNLARKFKANEFSGKLARLVREGDLTRTKNDENQYEYQSN